MKEQNIAELLHEATKDCSPGIRPILAAAKKAALKGKSWIKIRCDEADSDAAQYPAIYPRTRLVEELLENGFRLHGESDFGLFGWKYFLRVSW